MAFMIGISNEPFFNGNLNKLPFIGNSSGDGPAYELLQEDGDVAHPKHHEAGAVVVIKGARRGVTPLPERTKTLRE